MTKAVLVIGARSKVGTELVSQLLAKGERVRAATRYPGEYRAAAGVEVTFFDYGTPETMKSCVEDVDRVFMLSKWTDLHPEMGLNRLVELARTAEVKHLVFMNALGIDHNPPVSYGLVEKRIAGTGMGYTLLHPNWLMQTFSRGFWQPQISDISAIVAPGGSAAVSFVDARDVAAVAATALLEEGHSGKTYRLTGPQALTYSQVADTVAEVVGRTINYREASEEDFRAFLLNHAEPDQVEYILGLFNYVRDGQDSDVTDAVATVLGRAPISFEEFARDNAAVWK